MEPWPWYVAGAAIALVMLLLILSGRYFGMSSNLRTFCTLCGADHQAEFFKFDWHTQRWNLWVLAGTILGGFLGANYLSNEQAVEINPKTVEELHQMGVESAGEAYLPTEFFSIEQLTEPKTLLLLIVGGFLVGFGARYAGGCTSGHAISGLSNLQWPSLIAVIGFFAGGLTMIYLIFPIIFPS
jgi:uncharacterized membrane protein YedE/YeeE